MQSRERGLFPLNACRYDRDLPSGSFISTVSEICSRQSRNVVTLGATSIAEMRRFSLRESLKWSEL